jgi:hypothetical protein
MPRVRQTSQFTLAQLMGVIAALCIVFAVFPMPAAVVFVSFATIVFLLHRTRLPEGDASGLLPADPHWKGSRNPRASQRSMSCLFCLLGFIGGGFLGAISLGVWRADCGTTVLAAVPGYGFLGAILSGLIGHLVAYFRFRGISSAYQSRAFDPDETLSCRRNRSAELRSVDNLIARAQKDGDPETLTKLVAYRAKVLAAPEPPARQMEG